MGKGVLYNIVFTKQQFKRFSGDFFLFILYVTFIIFSSGDGQWFRALVRSHPSPTEVEVLYIDYGNSETRQLTDLRLPSIELLDAPAMALSCSLCGQ